MTRHGKKTHRPGLFSSVLLTTILALPLIGFADYNALKNQLDTYQPPALPTLERTAGPEKTELTPHRSAGKNIGEASPQDSEKEKAMALSGGEKSFFPVEPGALEPFVSYGADSPGTAALLAEPFTLKTLEIITLFRNRGIKSAKNQVTAELQAFDQVDNLNAILNRYTAFTEAVMNGVGPMAKTGSIKMTHPFPGVDALEGRIVKHSVRAALADLAMARREAVTAARKGYWNLVYIHKAREIITETLDRFQGLESVAATRYRAGKTSFQDVIKVTIKTKLLGEKLRTLEEKQKTMESKLLSLVDLPWTVPVGRPLDHRVVKRPPVLAPLFQRARENRQELLKIQATIAKMEAMVEMAETMVLPSFSLDLSLYEDRAVQQTGSAAMKPAFAETTTAARGAGLPKRPWFGTNTPWLNQTKQRLSAVKEKLKQTETQTDSLVRNAWFQLDRASRETTLFQETIVDLSGSALDVSTRGYESGRVSFADVIGSYTTWLDARLSLARKKSDMGIARAELSRVVGKTL
ncbi:MAG TPA: TolC family protein [Desulfobacteraceae bacterium]|nr:TolC family protein [Desulfobacteraceae bacterium]